MNHPPKQIIPLGLLLLLFCSAQSVFAVTADITSGLVHRWRFDETTGNRAADSVGTNHASLVNWTASEAKWVPGRIGGALDFGDTVALGNDNYAITDFSIPQEEYTIAFFLKTRPDDHNLNPRLVTPTDGYEGWVLLNQEFHRGVGFYYNTGAHMAQDPNPPVPEKWEHYAVVYDRLAGFTRIYRDGQEVAAGNVHNAATAEPHGRWVFGHHDNIVDHVDDSLLGLMDDIRIYNRLLEPADIAALAAIPEPSGLLLAVIAIGAIAWTRMPRFIRKEM